MPQVAEMPPRCSARTTRSAHLLAALGARLVLISCGLGKSLLSSSTPHLSACCDEICTWSAASVMATALDCSTHTAPIAVDAIKLLGHQIETTVLRLRAVMQELTKYHLVHIPANRAPSLHRRRPEAMTPRCLRGYRPDSSSHYRRRPPELPLFD